MYPVYSLVGQVAIEVTGSLWVVVALFHNSIKFNCVVNEILGIT